MGLMDLVQQGVKTGGDLITTENKRNMQALDALQAADSADKAQIEANVSLTRKNPAFWFEIGLITIFMYHFLIVGIVNDIIHVHLHGVPNIEIVENLLFGMMGLRGFHIATGIINRKLNK